MRISSLTLTSSITLRRKKMNNQMMIENGNSKQLLDMKDLSQRMTENIRDLGIMS